MNKHVTTRVSAKTAKPWKCDECGRRYTEKQAVRAMEHGCAAGCSGLDVREVFDDEEVTHGANTKGPATQSAVDDNRVDVEGNEFFPAHESNAARLGKNGEGRDSLGLVGASVAERQTTRTA